MVPPFFGGSYPVAFFALYPDRDTFLSIPEMLVLGGAVAQLLWRRRPDLVHAYSLPVSARRRSSGTRQIASATIAPNVRATQDDVVDWFDGNGRAIDMRTAWLLPPTRAGKEPSRRSRAAFFVLLAVVLAVVGATAG